MEYSAQAARKLISEFESLEKPKVILDLKLDHLAHHLPVPRSVVFLRQGVMRRLGIIQRCIDNVFTIFPPDRTKLLTKGELADISINVHAFVINVYGVFDNVAWVCCLDAGMPAIDKKKMTVGLFKQEMRPYIPESFLEFLDEGPSRTWFDDYAKLYRDSTAHRIPPYVPPSRMTSEDGRLWNELNEKSWRALTEDRDVDLHEELNSQKRGLEKITGTLALSLSGIEMDGPLIHMHPQLVCDVLTVHQLLENFDEAMRKKYAISTPIVPDFEVRRYQSPVRN